MDYDVVLATRNRPTVLKISVPLMLAQTRPLRRLIVVDSSDNHEEICEIIGGAINRAHSEVKPLILHTHAGSSFQRNVGLRHVESPVVIFPDDDSLWFPDSAEELMRIYESDQAEVVGCVALKASSTYPPGSFDFIAAPYKLEFRDRLSKRIRGLIGRIEDKFLPDPMLPGGTWTRVWGPKVPLVWLAQEDAELCGPVYGYRMSFRTSVIRAIGGFDEHLGQYAMFEDSDATIGALCRSVNVLANRARVHHYRVPDKRVNGWEFGMMAVLNRAYIVCKHSGERSPARRLLRRYLRYKVVRYFAQSHTAYGRQRLRGALYGMARLNQLLNTPAHQLTSCYLALRSSGLQEMLHGA